MPDIHIGLVELASVIIGGILSYGTVQWQTNQNKRDLVAFRSQYDEDLKNLKKDYDKDIEKMQNKHETLEKEIMSKLSDLLVSVAELKGQLRNNESIQKRT